MSKRSADGKTLKLKWDRTRIALQGCHWDMRAPDSEKYIKCVGEGAGQRSEKVGLGS